MRTDSIDMEKPHVRQDMLGRVIGQFFHEASPLVRVATRIVRPTSFVRGIARRADGTRSRRAALKALEGGAHIVAERGSRWGWCDGLRCAWLRQLGLPLWPHAGGIPLAPLMFLGLVQGFTALHSSKDRAHRNHEGGAPTFIHGVCGEGQTQEDDQWQESEESSVHRNLLS